MNKEKIHSSALELVTKGDVSTSHEPVIFTSCCKKDAEDFVNTHNGHALIHSTPAGKNLEDLNLFSHTSAKMAYLYWFILSTRFILENEYPDNVKFIGNPDNKTSTAFGIEIPLLFHKKDNVETLFNPLTGYTKQKDEWVDAKLMRPYVIELLNSYMNGAPTYERSEKEDTLFKKFSERADGIPQAEDHLELRMEYSLKLITLGMLAPHFPTEKRIDRSTLNYALI